jgi:hypothetical protein
MINHMDESFPWYRVFGSSVSQPAPEELLAAVAQANPDVQAQFVGDEQGWFRVELRLPGLPKAIEVQRFVAGVDDFRSDLNTWAAWVETHGDEGNAWLMQHLIGTAQLFVWQTPPASQDAVNLSVLLCDYLSRTTGGVYQVDGLGFFDAAGMLLLRESL